MFSQNGAESEVALRHRMPMKQSVFETGFLYGKYKDVVFILFHRFAILPA